MNIDAPKVSPIASGLLSFLTGFSNMIAGEIAKKDKKYLSCELVWDDTMDLPNMHKVLSNQISPRVLNKLMKGTLEMVPGIKKIDKISTLVETKSRRLFAKFQIELDDKTTVTYQPPINAESISDPERDFSNFKWLELAN